MGIAKFENTLTPKEVLEFVARKPYLGTLFPSHSALKKQKQIVDFQKTTFVRGLNFFQSSQNARTILICFTDKHYGLFGPIPGFLQAIGDREFDVVSVLDYARAYHQLGVEGQTSSIFETTQFIREKVNLASYDTVITYGCSMGGIAAIQCGLQLGADRAICIGGVFRSDSSVYREAQQIATAFDPICDCRPSASTEVVSLFCKNTYVDRLGAQALQRRTDTATVIECSSRKHDIFRELEGTPAKLELLRYLFDVSSDMASFSYSHFLSRAAEG
jgi:hypothetical protein